MFASQKAESRSLDDFCFRFAYDSAIYAAPSENPFGIPVPKGFGFYDPKISVVPSFPNYVGEEYLQANSSSRTKTVFDRAARMRIQIQYVREDDILPYVIPYFADTTPLPCRFCRPD